MEEVDKLYILTHKELTGEISEKENLSLKELLKDNGNSKLHDQIKADWKKANMKFAETFDHKKAFNEFLSKTTTPEITLNQKPNQGYKVLPIYKYTAAIAAIFILGIFALNIFSNELVHHSYQDGSIAYLPDNSKVFLSKGASIDFQSKFTNDRIVTLKGEAIFEVTKSKSSKFIVSTEDLNVTVLGTTFLVNTDQTSQEVKVLEGKVRVKSGEQEVLIRDREGVSLKNNGFLEKQNNINFSQSSSFYKPDLTYKNTPINKVFSDLEAHFQIRIDLSDNNDLSSCMFTSRSLNNLGLQDIFLIIEATYNSEIIQVEEKIYKVKKFTCK